MANTREMGSIEFPNDLVAEILLRLPVRSLLRFKSVCKYWHSLIDEFDFAARHHERSKEHLLLYYWNYFRCEARLLLLCREMGSVVTDPHLDIPELPRTDVRFLTGPCNGIFCIGGLYLWNPATKEVKTLPPPQRQCPDSHLRYCLHHTGYGFESKTNDFKVVTIHFPHYDTNGHPGRPHLIAQVYSLKSDSWREIDAVNVQPSRAISLRSQRYEDLHIDGTCSLVVKDTELKILSLNLHSEVFATTLFPDGCYGADCIFVLNGCIAMFNPLVGEGEVWNEIWVLKEIGDRESWTKLIKLGPREDLTLPLGYLKNDELLHNSEEGGGGELVWRHPLGQTTARVIEGYYFSRTCRYKESLFKLSF